MLFDVSMHCVLCKIFKAIFLRICHNVIFQFEFCLWIEITWERMEKKSGFHVIIKILYYFSSPSADSLSEIKGTIAVYIRTYI